MNLGVYLGMLEHGVRDLADAYRQVADAHREEPDVWMNLHTFADDCERQAEGLGPFLTHYGEESDDEPDRLEAEVFQEPRSGGLGLLRDLHDLYVMGHYADITWTMVGQAAKGLRDADLIETIDTLERHTAAQIRWLETRMKQAAPQALIVA